MSKHVAIRPAPQTAALSASETLPLSPWRVGDSLLTALLIALAVMPMLLVSQPPMVDVLGHIGRYTIQTSLSESAALQAYFGFEWKIIGNLGADIIVAMLAPLLGVEASVRIILAATQAMAAAGILILSRQRHGRITPFAILALPLIYSFPFSFGFINFTLSMSLALLAFSLWLRLSSPERIGLRQWLFVPVSLAVWLAHTFGWGFLGLLCAAAALDENQRRHRTAARALIGTAWTCLPLAAPLLPMLLWRSQSSGAMTDGWLDFGAKLGWLVSPLRLEWKWIDIGCALLLYGVILIALRSRKIALDPVFRIAALFCLIAFMLLPGRMFGSSFADMRLVPYLMITALLVIGPAKLGARTQAALFAGASLFLALRLALTASVYTNHERDLDQHLEALSAIPPGARVATLVTMPCGTDWTLPWLSHVGSMAIARRHAFANDQWYVSGINMLDVRLPAAGAYQSDPAHMVYPDRCAEPGYSLAHRLATLPTAAFSHVWTVGIDPARLAHRSDLDLVWARGDSAVFATVPAGVERAR